MSNNWTTYLLFLMPLFYVLFRYLRSKQKREQNMYKYYRKQSMQVLGQCHDLARPRSDRPVMR